MLHDKRQVSIFAELLKCSDPIWLYLDNFLKIQVAKHLTFLMK
jgi:hypothetical protein